MQIVENLTVEGHDVSEEAVVFGGGGGKRGKGMGGKWWWSINDSAMSAHLLCQNHGVCVY